MVLTEHLVITLKESTSLPANKKIYVQFLQ